MKKSDLIWLAGFFEGRGAWNFKGGKTKEMVPKLVITHSDLAVVTRISGLISQITGRPAHRPYLVYPAGSERAVHKIYYQGGQVVKVGKAVLPHMWGNCPRVAKIRRVCGL